jgi:RHS repeat-associated protein
MCRNGRNDADLKGPASMQTYCLMVIFVKRILLRLFSYLLEGGGRVSTRSIHLGILCAVRKSFQRSSASITYSELTPVLWRWAFSFWFLCGFGTFAIAQPTPGTGFPPFASIQGGGFDGVNLQSLDFAFSIPIVSHPGRGLGFDYSLAYNSPVWRLTTKNSVTSWGFIDRWTTDGPIGSMANDKQTIPIGSCQLTTWNNFTYTDQSGTPHLFPVARYLGCGAPPNVVTGHALDASGYFVDISTPSGIVRAPDGTQINFATSSTLDSSNNLTTHNPTITDANGNQISSVSCFPGNGPSPCISETDWTDSLGQVVLKIGNQANASGFISEVDYKRLAVDGTYQNIAMKYEFVNVQSNFGCSGVGEFVATNLRLVSEIDLPNGQKYLFTYEPTPGVSGSVTGRLQTVTLPTGGTVTYQYPGPNGGINCGDGSSLQLSRTVSDGLTPAASWTYSRTPNNKGGTTTITAPLLPYDSASNQTVVTFDPTLGLETSRQIYKGTATGTPLRTINTAWTNNNSSFSNTPTSQTTFLEDGSTQTQVETTYDTNGLLQVKKEHDWGFGIFGVPGPVVRVTTISYLNSSNYVAANIINKILTEIVADSNGTVKRRTDMSYDDPGSINTKCITGAPMHDDVNYGCSYTFRGLLTGVTTYADAATPSGGITKTFQYDSVGNLLLAQLDCCQQKKWAYSATTQYAFPDSVVSGLGSGTQLSTSSTYFLTTGQVKTATDENGKVTTYSYADPGHLDRLIDVIRPDSAHVKTSYDDLQMKMTTSSPVQNSDVIQNITAFDGLGRPVTTTIEDKSNTVYSMAGTQYDPVGRAYKSSNPATSAPQFWTTNQFDAIGRRTVTLLPDGAQGTFVYSKTSVTASDPAGKQRRSFNDGLGRLIEVDEPGSASVGQQSTGSITINDPLNIIQPVASGSGAGSFTIKGREGSITSCFGHPIPTCHTTYDLGSVQVTVNLPGNTITKTASYGQNVAAQDLANSLAGQFSGTGFFTNVNTVNSTGADGIPAFTVNLTANAVGSVTNYSYSATQTGTHNDFVATTAGPAFTGGVDGRTGATDSGTITLKIGSFTTTAVCYGPSCNNTASAVAAGLASALGAPGSPVGQIRVTGSTIVMTANQASSTWNVPITATPTSGDPADFPQGSFGSQGSLAGGADPYPAGLNHPDVTTYSYSVLDDPLQVTQGVQTRSNLYDDMGRITDSTTPEGGHTSFQYNSFSLISQRTDARGVITRYGYDDLNRLQTVTYNVGTTGVPATPALKYTYGTDSTQNNNGRILTVTDGAGSETYAYDVMGRPTMSQKVINGVQYTVSYSYNLAGELTQLTYPSGNVVQQSFDVIGRLCEISPQTSGCGTAVSAYATGYGYNSGNQMTGFIYGNGVSATFGYSPDRLQLTNLSYQHGSQTLFSLGYVYSQDPTNCPNAPAGNNSQIQCILDHVDAGRTVAYSYDLLGRLATAATNGSASSPNWSLAFTYDRYGNRTQQSVVAGSAFPVSSPVEPTTNRFNVGTYSYDLNGNMTNDGNNLLTYDADNRVVGNSQSGTTTSYSYDYKGLRVQKSSPGTAVVYVFSGNKVISEYANGAAPTTPTREYIYSGSGLLAKIEAGITNFYHTDHLSTRLTSDVNANVAGQQGLFPFGDPWYDSGATSKKKLGDFERDAESGNDYALARYDISRLGRFSSPDPVAGSLGYPQSLNRYSYAGNDPINSSDPSGRFVVGIDRFLSGSNFGNNGFFGENWDEFFFLENPLQVGTATLYHSNSVDFNFENFNSSELANFAQQGELSTLGQWPIYQYVFLNFSPKSAATPDKLTSNKQLLNILYCLFKRGGFGFKQTERSTWITENSGNVGEVQWPWSAAANHDTWKGPIPSDAVAFAHTHPSNMDPKPSSGGAKTDDVAANTTGLPNYVVTRDAIWKQSPNQKQPQQVAGDGWSKDAQESEKKGQLKCK